MAQHSIHKFVLGNKELEGKIAEFQYDRGVYTITDIVGEERSVVYKSRNAQEAYMKWNVYIGRKKERPQREINRRDNDRDPSAGESRGMRYDSSKNDTAFDMEKAEHTEEKKSENERQRRAEEHKQEDFRKRHHKRQYNGEQKEGFVEKKNKDENWNGRKKQNVKNKFRRDRRPKGEYKRNNKVRNYENSEE